MGRPRGFDEDQVIRAAVVLFSHRAYDSVSVDDLVEHVGVHRNSLYKTFGSKRGLYLAALRRSFSEDVAPLADAAGAADSAAEAVDLLVHTPPDAVGLDLLLLAAVERASADAEVATEVGNALARIEAALARVAPDRAAHLADAALGGRLRARLPGRRLSPDAPHHS
ncbi:TetR/AcrR family transcriptional regulator [Streptomyces niveus]|uniref:TetR/AcrR family transcriptional regulator n=1 Tax=Streptomyces niveus TaxID=193462 RepID=UPI0036BD5108